MKYKQLPEHLAAGDRIACRRAGYDPPEVLEILKLYEDGRVLLCRENGTRPFVPLEMRTLQEYGYELCVPDETEEGKK